MLGISVYLSDFDADYLRKASKYVDYVFTSLHIMEEDFDRPKMQEILALCRELKLKVICDISPATFTKLGVEPQNFAELKKLGIETVRLDFGYEDESSLECLRQYFEVVLNASIVEADQVTLHQLDKVSHNFYPLTGSACERTTLAQKNALFRAQNIRTQFFIPGDQLKRFPLYAGLPTLEDQRWQNPYIAGLELLKELKADDIIVGDSQISLCYLKYLYEYLESGIINVECHLRECYRHLYGQTFTLRKDSGRDFWRLNSQRQQIKPSYNGRRQLGDILQFNQLAGRYSGEIYLPKANLSGDAASNNLGFIHPEFTDLLPLISAEDTLRLVPLS